MLDRTETDIRLAIVGDGPEAPALERRIFDAEVGDRIRLFPFSGSSDPHMAALDALLLPSDVFESLPIGVIEGMAHSLPVIASDIGGLPEVIQTGVDGLPGPARGIRAARGSDQGPRRGPGSGGRARDGGRELVESRFSLERMIDELEREYLEVSAAG